MDTTVHTVFISYSVSYEYYCPYGTYISYSVSYEYYCPFSYSVSYVYGLYLHHSLQIYVYHICTPCCDCCSRSQSSPGYLNIEISTVLLAIPFIPHTSYLFIHLSLLYIRTHSALTLHYLHSWLDA